MDFTKTINTLKLLLVTVLVGSVSLYANATTTFKDSASGLYFGISSDGTTCYVTQPTSGTYSGNVVIPSKVTYNSTEYKVTVIGLKAFYNCTSLESVTIPETVNNISVRAFEGCTNLTSINIPDGVTNIGSYAFLECNSIPSLTLPESVTSIGGCAFKRCISLTSINIPKNITIIFNDTFSCCNSLSSIILPENLTTIEVYAFYSCTSLKGVYTNKFTDEYQNVLIIPNSVTSIGTSAFENCTSLENIWIGNGCTSISSKAFSGDTKLKAVSSMRETAPSLTNRDTFSDYTYKNATLYIQDGEDVWNSYTDNSVNYWYLFLNNGTSTYGTDDGGIQVGVGEVANDDIAVTTDGKAIEITGYEGETSVYNVAGMRVYQGNDNRIELPNAGIYVVVVNGKSYKVAIK